MNSLPPKFLINSKVIPKSLKDFEFNCLHFILIIRKFIRINICALTSFLIPDFKESLICSITIMHKLESFIIIFEFSFFYLVVIFHHESVTCLSTMVFNLRFIFFLLDIYLFFKLFFILCDLF